MHSKFRAISLCLLISCLYGSPLASAAPGKIKGTAGGMERGVEVFAKDGSLVGWTVTGPSGLYEFGGVEPGEYFMLLNGKIVPYVKVRPGETTTVDQATQPKFDLEKELWGPARVRFAQSFVATGTAVTDFSLWRSSGKDKLIVSLYEDSPAGKRVAGPFVTEKDMVWICGSGLPAEQFQTTPGKTYALEIASATETPWNHSMPRRPNVYADGIAYYDGVAHPESDLGIEINQSQPGLVTIAAAREDLHFIAEGPGSGSCRVAGQTFVANASNVVMAFANCGGWGGGIAELIFSIHQDGPGGKQVGPACNVKMVCDWGSDVVWFADTVKLERGRQYYLQYRRADDKPFFSYLSADKYAKGRAYRDGEPLDDQFDQLCYILGEEQPDSVTYPYNVHISNVAENSATVTWDTGTKADSLVHFGTDRYLQQKAGSTDESLREHHIELKNLEGGAVYLYRVSSDTGRKSSRRMYSRIYSFMTSPQGRDKPRFDRPTRAKAVARSNDSVRVVHGSFEDGLKGWQRKTRKGRAKEPQTYVPNAEPFGDACAGMDGYEPHSGSGLYGWSYFGSEDPTWTEPREDWKREVIFQSVPVEPGGKYELTAWILTGDLGSGWGRDCRIRLIVDENGANAFDDFEKIEQANVTQWFATQHHWLPVVLQFEARSDRVTIGAEFLQWWALQASHLYIDDFSIRPQQQ